MKADVSSLLRWRRRCHPSHVTQLAAVLLAQTTLFYLLNVFRQQRCRTSISLVAYMALEGMACPPHGVGWRGTVKSEHCIVSSFIPATPKQRL